MALGFVGSFGLAAGKLDLLPTPQECTVGDGRLGIAGDGKTITMLLSKNASAKEKLAAAEIAKEIEKLSGANATISPYSKKAGEEGAVIMMGVFKRNTAIDEAIMKQLDEQDNTAFSDPQRTGQVYVLRATKSGAVIMGNTDQGTLCGAMTLLQMLEKDGKSLSIPHAVIRDWPDHKYRIAENWTYAEGRSRAGAGWCYDWGDGLENYMKRAKQVIDRCMRYKINVISYHGDFYSSLEGMWRGDDMPFAIELNRYARARGVKLMYGTMAYGGVNRKSYPKGDVYKCVGYPVLGERPERGRTNGTCRSNEALNKIKADLAKKMIRELEPGCVYIHGEDIATYDQAAMCWKIRCDECRKLWPNDTLEAKDGGVAGFAHGYNVLLDAIFSVKNPKTGYDASRDCLVYLVSPCYTSAAESDASWDKQLIYWRSISKLIKYRDNVNICIREQFLRKDNNKRRVGELARAIRKEGGGHGVFVFSVCTTSIYGQGILYAARPAIMNKVNEGAESIYFFCGRIFQEPQVLINAEYMWNNESDGHYENPKTYEACKGMWGDYITNMRGPAPYVYGEGGFLQRSCERLYGKEAAGYMRELHLMKVMPAMYGRRIDRTRKGRRHNWPVRLQATERAIELVTSALASEGVPPENRPTLAHLLKALNVGKRFAEARIVCDEIIVLAEAGSEEADARIPELETKMKATEKYLADNYSFKWVTAKGGDHGYWQAAIDGMRKDLIRRRSDAKLKNSVTKMIPEGVESIVVNGEMEEDGAWEFKKSPGATYSNGGFMSGRKATGKRSYKITHPPRSRSDRWPEGRKSEWGQISQTLVVEPEREYIVVFAVYNAYGGAKRFLEHQVLIDGKKKWFIDAGASQGWKYGSFKIKATGEKTTLTLRTEDLRWTHGWGDAGSSWWDCVGVYPLRPEADN